MNERRNLCRRPSYRLMKRGGKASCASPTEPPLTSGVSGCFKIAVQAAFNQVKKETRCGKQFSTRWFNRGGGKRSNVTLLKPETQ